MYIRKDEFGDQTETPSTQGSTQQYMQPSMQQYDQQSMQPPMQQYDQQSMQQDLSSNYQYYPMTGCQMGVNCPFAQTCPLLKGNISMPSNVGETQSGMMSRPYDDDKDYQKYHHHPYYHHYHHPYHPYYHPYYPPYFTPYNVFPWILGGLFTGHR